MNRSYRDFVASAIERNGGRTVVALLCLILALAFGLRAEAAISGTSDPTPDAKGYAVIAQSLYEKGTFGSQGDFAGIEVQEPTNYSPGAPLLYAGVYYATFGAHPALARLLVALLGTLAVLFAFLIARRLAGPVAGLIAALALAVYLPFITYNRQLMSEPVAAFTLAGAVLSLFWAADRTTSASPTGDAPKQMRPWLLPGLMFGLTALVRPEYLVFGAVMAVLVFAKLSHSGGWRPGARAAGLLVVAFLIPIVPWTIRNLIVLDRFVPLSTGGGKALFIGTYLPGDGINGHAKVHLLHLPRVQAYLKRTRGHSHVHTSKVYLDEILGHIASVRYPGVPTDVALRRMGEDNISTYLSDRPWDFMGMLANKVWYMWRKGPLAQMKSRPWILLHRSVVLLGLIGIGVLAWRRRWEALVFASLIGGVTAISAILLTHPRRALALLPLVFALAGATVVWGVDWARTRLGAPRELANPPPPPS